MYVCMVCKFIFTLIVGNNKSRHHDLISHKKNIGTQAFFEV